MSNSKDNHPKTLLEGVLRSEPERVIEMPRSNVIEMNNPPGFDLTPNITSRSVWVKSPARKLTPEKSYYDLQDVLNWFASNNGFDVGSIEGDKVVIYKGRKK